MADSADRGVAVPSRRAIGFFAALVGLVLAQAPTAQAGTSAAIVIDAASGTVLYESNADARAYPASLTKMMTLYMLFEALESGRPRLDKRLEVSRHAASMGETNIDLRRGDGLTVKQAIRAIVVRSANDASAVVAEALGGGEGKFAEMMTGKARRLGMTQTRFRNASGLPDPAQRTTARDIAILARALLTDFPQYYRYFNERKFSFRGRTYISHNRLMGAYPGADGLKTGYIRASGYNLAASAKRDGRRVIVVVLGGRSAGARDIQTARLLDKGFATLRKQAAVRSAGADGAAAPESKTVSASTTQLATPPPAKPVRASVAAADLPLPGSKPVLVAAADPAVAPAPNPGDTRAPALDPGRERLVTGGRWAIQVGAYSKFAPAHAAAQKAMKVLARLLAGGRIVIDERPGENGMLYRARIAGLTQKMAQAACRELKSKKNGCLVFSPGTAMAMSSN